jgi:two-component system, NarL family, response regulator LiaR
MLKTVCLLEDDLSLATIMASLISSNPNLAVSHISHTLQSALSAYPNAPTDIALVDLQLPDGNGLDFVKFLKAQFPDTIIVMCTSFDDDTSLFESLKAGAIGYIVKTDEPEKIVEYINLALAGGAPMSAGIALKVVKHFQQSAQQPTLEVLTKKEHVILEALSQGLFYKEIADQQNITIDGIRKHCSNIYKKLHVNNRTEAANIYFRSK